MSILKTCSNLLRASRTLMKQNTFQIDVCRTLYSEAALGLDSFEYQKNRVRTQISDVEEKFRTKMSEYVTENSKNIIFTEDLKNMIYLAKEGDVDLVVKMMKRFNSQNKELRFGNFIFGPVVMRMFYKLNKPNEALECYKSPELTGFFDQLMSHQVLFDLLYENKMYNEMLDLYNLVKEKQIESLKWARSLVVLTMAACYKLNTEESLEFAIKLWKDISQVGNLAARRSITFCAALMINKGKPEIALEILSSLKNQNYTTVRNLKVLTLLQLKRIDDVLPILKSVLTEEAVHTFNKDVVEAVENYLKSENNAELTTEFNRVVKYYKEHGNISESTLDDNLCSVINKLQPRPDFNQYGQLQRRDQNNRRPRYDFNDKKGGGGFTTRKVSLSQME
nr:pentatricopeptide repeat-containing protein 2, mitochondrial-like [Onthophagus taurus]